MIILPKVDSDMVVQMFGLILFKYWLVKLIDRFRVLNEFVRMAFYCKGH